MKTGRKVIELISLAYEAGRPVLLRGPHGIGKSEILEQAARKLGIGFISRDLSLMEPPDLVGLPRNENGRTVYAPPSFLPMDGKGILVFEELNRCERYMMAPCLQLLTARRLNDYILPKGWLPVAAVNPDGGAYDVNAIDPALESRFIVIDLEPSRTDWLSWAEGHGIHSAVVRYVRDQADVFNAEKSNPRAWAYVADVIRQHENSRKTDSGVLREAISGLVGSAHASAFLSTYRDDEGPLAADQVLSAYDKHRPVVLGWVKAKRTDLLQATATNVHTLLMDSDEGARTAGARDRRERLAAFLGDLPADIAKGLRTFLKSQGVLR